MKELEGQIVKGVGGLYWVKTTEGVLCAVGRGKLRAQGALMIGDRVVLQQEADSKASIERVLPRKNRLVRPYVSNVDALVIVIAPVPEPDFLLVDKLLIDCVQNELDALICINKKDLITDDLIEKVQADYRGIAQTVAVSARSKIDLSELTRHLSGKCICFAGQSAVGKSSIINTVLKTDLKTGEISLKTGRGRHTTRQVELIDAGDFVFADSCGFSSLEIPLIDPRELKTFYTDYDTISKDCKYKGCLHLEEPDCAVKQAVADGVLSERRYQRYRILYREVRENWSKRYGK